MIINKCCGFVIILLFLFGVGKLILVCCLMDWDLILWFFVLVMMCKFCLGEVDGEYYYFKSCEEFEQMVDVD